MQTKAHFMDQETDEDLLVIPVSEGTNAFRWGRTIWSAGSRSTDYDIYFYVNMDNPVVRQDFESLRNGT